MPITVGQVLHSKYRLVRLLGDGGMGAVYEATHERLGTRVAIKVLHSEIASRPGIVERFLQEARVSAQIRSAHVAQVIDVDQTPEGDAYMVMELLIGETLLSALERERKLPIPIACDYGRQILAGLEAAHDVGVVHRDLKPENVFVTRGGGRHLLKLIDFGIAKVRRADMSANLTLAGVAMGTAEYMAPEQAFSASTADARSDIYAVGVMVYEMLSGQRPVMGDDPRIIAFKVERGELKSLAHLAPEVPGPLAGLVHRAMAPRPDLRFQTAAEMRAALTAFITPDSVASDPALSATVPTARTPPPSGVIVSEPPGRGPSTQRGTPVHHDAFGPGIHPSGEFDEPEPVSIPRRGVGIGPIVALALLLGIGVVVALMMMQQPKKTIALPVPSTPPVGSLVVMSESASTTATSSSDLRPLRQTDPPHASSRPVSSGTPHRDAGARSGLPSSFPNPFPSMTVPFPIPSVIPTDFTLPGFGPN